jgi:hypothetical protein
MSKYNHVAMTRLHLIAREGAPSAIRGISDAIVAIITAIRGGKSGA